MDYCRSPARSVECCHCSRPCSPVESPPRRPATPFPAALQTKAAFSIVPPGWLGGFPRACSIDARPLEGTWKNWRKKEERQNAQEAEPRPYGGVHGIGAEMKWDK